MHVVLSIKLASLAVNYCKFFSVLSTHLLGKHIEYSGFMGVNHWEGFQVTWMHFQ